MSSVTNNAENLTETVGYAAEKLQAKMIFESGAQKTMLMAFSSGHSLPEHTTPKDALLIILEGICEFSMFGEGQLLKAGEVIRIPANEPHHLLAITAFKMLLIK